MKIETQRELIRNTARKFREAYRTSLDAPSWKGNGTRRDIADALDALDLESVSAQEVCAVIGNDSWTSMRCDECKEYVPAVIRLGDEPDYESSTAYLCPSCVGKALEALEAAGLRTGIVPLAGVIPAAPATQKGVCPKCGGGNISDLGPDQLLFKRYKCLTCFTLHDELTQPEATYGGGVSVQDLDHHDVAAAILEAKP